jgi:hypothetical protein
LVFAPREDTDPRLVVRHDRAGVHVAPGSTIEKVEQVADVGAAGGHHEAGDVEHHVPLAVAEDVRHLIGLGPVGDQSLDTRRHLGRGHSAVQHGDGGAAGMQHLDEVLAHEHRATEHERPDT